jgi:hypothetical protein
VVTDLINHEICIFHTRNIKEFKAVFDKKINSNL